MKQYSTLIRKEWQTHKNSFLIPFYVVSGILVLFALISFYALARYGSSSFTLVDFPALEKHYLDILVWNLVVGIAGVIGMFCLATMSHVNESMLNHDHQKKCEILHSAQPCNPMKIIAAKLSLSFIGIILQYIMIIIIGALILGAFLTYMGQNFWLVSVQAALSTLPMLMYASFVINSGVWFFSCLFRRKSSVYSWIFIVGGHLMHLIIQNTWKGINFPSPLTFIFNTIMRIFSFKNLPGFSFGLKMKALSTGELVLHLTVATGLYLLGYYLYKNREIM